MVNLKDCTDRQLTEELQRRANERAKRNDRPKRIAEPDWDTLTRLIDGLVAQLDETGSVRDDADRLVFEMAMTALYGHRIFGWWNERRARG